MLFWKFNYKPLDDEIPWIPFRAQKWLKKYLKPDMKVFEYGSGGSTLFFARRVVQVVSVEHNREWFDQVYSAIQQKSITNCRYLLQEPEGEGYNGIYSCTTKFYRGKSFERYVKTIDEYPDGYFDLVAVDGRARPACMAHAICKIRPGGYLLLDNAERKEYNEAKAKLDKLKRIKFYGPGPGLIRPWQAIFWQIER